MAGLFSPQSILKAAGTDLLCDLDLTNGEVAYLLDLADEVKRVPRDYGQVLAGKSIGMLFEKPSLRTSLPSSWPSASWAATRSFARAHRRCASR